MILYHGSNKEIKRELKPHKSFHYVPYVYATTDYYYALVRAGKFDIKNFLLKEDYDGEVFTLVELKPNAFEETFNTQGYIYIVDNNSFYHKKDFMNNEYVSEKKCNIRSSIYITNVKEQILKYHSHYNIIKHESEEYESYWENVKGCKEGYLQRRKERIEKLIQ